MARARLASRRCRVRLGLLLAGVLLYSWLLWCAAVSAETLLPLLPGMIANSLILILLAAAVLLRGCRIHSS